MLTTDTSIYYLVASGIVGLIITLALTRIGSPINWNDIAPACQ